MRPRCIIDKEIDIAGSAGIATQRGAKQAEFVHGEFLKQFGVGGKGTLHFCGIHNGILSEISVGNNTPPAMVPALPLSVTWAVFTWEFEYAYCRNTRIWRSRRPACPGGKVKAEGFDFVKDKANVDGLRIGKIAAIAVLSGRGEETMKTLDQKIKGLTATRGIALDDAEEAGIAQF